MFSDIFSSQNVSPEQVVDEVPTYFQQSQIADGAIPDASIFDYPTASLLRKLDTVNALKTIAMWRHLVPL